MKDVPSYLQIREPPNLYENAAVVKVKHHLKNE